MQVHQPVPKLLIVGCGDLGSMVAKKLSAEGLETFGLRRRNTPIDGVHMIQADVTQAASLDALKKIPAEILIYCVAANGQTDEQYKAHYVDGLRNVLMTQSNNAHLKHVFFVSSTRVYGQQTDAILDESTSALAADFGGERLLEAEALLKDLACNSTALRLSGIYGPGRLRMINLAKLPQSWPTQDGWTNRIHRDDAATFITFLVQKVLANQEVASCYIVTDSKPSKQYEVLTWIAQQMQLFNHAQAPTVVTGKRLSNQKMLNTGFQLQFPDYKIGYQSLLNDLGEQL